MMNNLSSITIIKRSISNNKVPKTTITIPTGVRCITTGNFVSSSITYSGGHASLGQGGFYGSGGARSYEIKEQKHYPEALAQVRDVIALKKMMMKCHEYENELSIANSQKDTAKIIEWKNNIKKLMTTPVTSALINKLIINGQPVWGLTSEEREMVKMAKKTIHKC